jgi:hypothetical protein
MEVQLAGIPIPFSVLEKVPKWSFYIFDFGTYKPIVPALNLKALKRN